MALASGFLPVGPVNRCIWLSARHGWRSTVFAEFGLRPIVRLPARTYSMFLNVAIPVSKPRRSLFDDSVVVIPCLKSTTCTSCKLHFNDGQCREHEQCCNTCQRHNVVWDADQSLMYSRYCPLN